jgi:uncharacterized protein involved in response to NO
MATLAGIVGVALWPLHLLGFQASYPGQIHARIMAHGLFGGFILGFLGTAMPRMLSAKPLRVPEAAVVLLLHLGTVIAYATGYLRGGNALFLSAVLVFVCLMVLRLRDRKDLPPPGFVLVALSIACAAAGALLGATESGDEVSPYRIALQRLFTYQGFILFPILGIGPFILPRFFGLSSPHDLPESKAPSRGWTAKAALAVSAGAIIIWTFFLEAGGSYQLAYALRFAAALGYILLEMPLKAAQSANVFGLAIRIALLGILGGFLAIAFYPKYRVALLHLTLVGGFAVITFVVATRVLFGHSGNIALLQKKNRWFPIALGLMLFAMATRISGDFWPKIMASHYIYGAILWIVAVILWAIFTLPKAFVADSED